MAYETGAASDLEDLISKVDTFMVANGWTQDQLDTGANQAAWSKNSVFVSVAWATTASTGEMSIHQATGYSGGNRPGTHTGDSGNGYNTGASPTEVNILTERGVQGIGNGPFPSYHIFEQDSGPAHVYVVVEISSEIFRHFGWGEADKTGDWSGGEFAYGSRHTVSSAVSNSNVCLLDGLFLDTSGENERRAATMRISGMPNQPGGSVWGQVWGADGSTIPDDTASNAKINIQGGFRSGPIARALGWVKAGTTSGLIPGYPIALWWNDEVNDFVYFLGYMANVRGVNIETIAPGQEVVIGSDTWVFFPTAQKTLVTGSNRSYHQGLMYKKVTA